MLDEGSGDDAKRDFLIKPFCEEQWRNTLLIYAPLLKR
jgi:hypothetical protein